MKKERQQRCNVIFIWDKKLNLNPKPNSKPSPKPLFYFILILNNFDYGPFQLNNEGSYPWFSN
jgi:hypothetical protein